MKHAKEKLQKVIDADNMKLLETFEKKDTQKKLAHYQKTGKWDDVSIDHGGDIILWES